MYHLLKFGILFVTPLATISIPYLSREISKDNSKVTETNRNSSVNLDGSIILINENKLDFGSPCELFLNDVALKNKQ
ncbi:hypothetical protein OVS_01000 [Mycoplasma ovis str. Michigan]|uniref:Uncharacterized protein n=1 Tax=Mycoplasma ovis str. Michigan TaxID=1415773 RepID=A0ABN4BLE5_9MOLU|nr:hypothetical protein [Mycoplasma ovis]AHC40168.1 hypothetical protein OVS_01000 [Mycoplasma ovis str. Michigan]